MHEAFIAALNVFATGVLIFSGAACFAGGLHFGWVISNKVYGTLEPIFRRGTDHEGGV